MQIKEAISALAVDGYNAKHLLVLANLIPRLPDSQLNEAFAEFHNIAGRLPYWNDSDVGALILESVSDGIPPSAVQKRIYKEAFYRAKWCATSSTSGGEGLARSRHVKRLSSKVRETPECGEAEE